MLFTLFPMSAFSGHIVHPQGFKVNKVGTCLALAYQTTILCYYLQRNNNTKATVKRGQIQCVLLAFCFQFESYFEVNCKSNWSVINIISMLVWSDSIAFIAFILVIGHFILVKPYSTEVILLHSWCWQPHYSALRHQSLKIHLWFHINGNFIFWTTGFQSANS